MPARRGAPYGPSMSTTTTTPAPTVDHLGGPATLPSDMLEAFRSRAADHDRDGTFPHADLADLRSVGWLGAAAPVDAGGLGLDLARLAAEQRRLARYAPATALATCMHHYWVGLAADLRPAGLPLAERMLGWVASGEVLASGHGEVGNDIPVNLSTTRAERVSGGYRLHGRKHFGSLGPVWDRLGFHAMDTTDPLAPVVVHGFVPRTTPGVTVVETWDAHGMRATESHDTVLDGAFVPDDDILCVVPAGPSDNPAVGAMLVWALTLIANVYLGVAERAFELAVDSATSRTSIAIPRATFAHHPLVQRQVASMHLELDAAAATLDRLADVDGRCRPRAGLGAQGAVGEVAGHDVGPGGRRPRVRGRRRIVVPPGHRDRAAVARRARRPLPPRDRRVHPRDDR